MPAQVDFAIGEKFNVSVDEGDATGKKWIGEFWAKPRLSHSDSITVDRIRRELLGANAQGASPRAAQLAMIFAELAVRITKAPQWWAASAGGQNLEDDNVVAAVYNGAIAVETRAAEERKRKAEEAKEVLRKKLEEEAGPGA